MIATVFRATLVAGMSASAIAQAGPARAVLPLRYATTCPPPGDPSAITITDSPKGPVVTFERAEDGLHQTRDDNLAFVSRRFFFKLRTATELIEFQGMARDGALEGLLSDAHGARRIVLPHVSAAAQPGCEAKP